MGWGKRWATSVGVLFAVLLFWVAPTAAEQVWYVNKSNGCRFSIPVHSPDVKLLDIAWNGNCKEGLADGEGPILIKFYLQPNERAVIIVEGTMTMAAGVPNGRASLRWNYGATFEGDYVNGERTRGVLKFNGDSYEGEFFQDLFHGKGICRYKNGDSYEGDWAKGKRQGVGILKGPDGKIKYQGEWVNDYAGNDPSANRVLKGFLNIPWGTGLEETEKTLKSRPGNFNTSFWVKNSLWWGAGKSNDPTRYTYMLGKFNDELAYIWAYYFEDKFFLGQVIFFNSEQEIMGKFETVKNDLTARYGPPSREEGKFLDTIIYWEFQEGNVIALKIQRLGYDRQNYSTGSPEINNAFKKPFNLTISYAQGTVFRKLYSAATIQSKSDY